jgi:Mrp family chromosome partitioning ATPase/capsular polysaccharide biosynthesis protein
VTETPARRPTTLTDYLAILRRRKLMLVVVPVVTALGALQYSSSRPSVYQAQTRVMVIPVSDRAAADPARYLRNVAQMARAPALARRVAAAAGVPGLTAGEVLAASTVTPDPDADMLNIWVSHANPRAAVLVANTYAGQLPRYKDALEAQTSGNKMSNLTVLEPAADATKTQPRPRHDFILGGLLGAVFAVGLVVLAEALDRRVRNDAEVEELLRLPLLGRVSRPPHPLRTENRLVMLAEPTGVYAEMFRKLRGAIEFANLQRGAASTTIMFTSAVQREGKSTTVANLAIALAQSEQRVVLVDLDLRQPFLHTFFGVRDEPGFVDAVVGRETLDRAIRHLSLPASGGLDSVTERNGQRTDSFSAPTRASETDAALHFLPSGTIPPAPGAFLATERASALLAELHRQFDVVLVDAPPLTLVGDAMTLSAVVDAIVVVASVRTNRPVLEELAHELQNCRAPTLGVVLTGVPLSEGYRDDYWYGLYHYRDRLRAHLRQLLFGTRPRSAPTASQRPDASRDQALTSPDADTGKRKDAQSNPQRRPKSNRARRRSAPTASRPPDASRDQALTSADTDTSKHANDGSSPQRRPKGNRARPRNAPTADQPADAPRDEAPSTTDSDTSKRKDAESSRRRRPKSNGARPRSAPTAADALDAPRDETPTNALEGEPTRPGDIDRELADLRVQPGPTDAGTGEREDVASRPRRHPKRSAD